MQLLKCEGTHIHKRIKLNAQQLMRACVCVSLAEVVSNKIIIKANVNGYNCICQHRRRHATVHRTNTIHRTT